MFVNLRHASQSRGIGGDPDEATGRHQGGENGQNLDTRPQVKAAAELGVRHSDWKVEGFV